MEVEKTLMWIVFGLLFLLILIGLYWVNYGIDRKHEREIARLDAEIKQMIDSLSD